MLNNKTKLFFSQVKGSVHPGLAVTTVDLEVHQKAESHIGRRHRIMYPQETAPGTLHSPSSPYFAVSPETPKIVPLFDD